jgi:inosine/xanthosine triphosphatase
MKINVGSENVNKVNGVKAALLLYPELFPNAEVLGTAIELEEFGHPKDIEQIMKGAVGRAKAAFKDCDFSFGLESGLVATPLSRSGYMEVPACAIYDGKNIYTGFGCAFEWPKKILDLILKNEADASLAFKKLRLTEHEKIGNTPGGIVGFLTSGRLTRKEQTKQSIIMALIQLEHKELY